jgi:universal stress protein A
MKSGSLITTAIEDETVSESFSEYRHLLVPLDFTARNDLTLDAAHDMAAKSKAQVTLIHVVEPVGEVEDEELEAFTQNLSDEAAQKLRQRAERFSDLGINVVCENRLGKRTVEIVSYAASEDVDLILLNSHIITRESQEKPAFSLSYQVALLAPCAVLLLKS